MIKIAIAEPSQILRNGLVSLLRDVPDTEVVFSTDNLNALFSRLPALHADILIINPLLFDYSHRATLRAEFDNYPDLHIVFTGSSVMRLKEENPELNGIVKSYNLRGFSFREFLNLHNRPQFQSSTGISRIMSLKGISMASHSSREAAMGFSQMACFPARRAFTVISAWT